MLHYLEVYSYSYGTYNTTTIAPYYYYYYSTTTYLPTYYYYYISSTDLKTASTRSAALIRADIQSFSEEDVLYDAYDWVKELANQ